MDITKYKPNSSEFYYAHYTEYFSRYFKAGVFDNEGANNYKMRIIAPYKSWSKGQLKEAYDTNCYILVMLLGLPPVPSNDWLGKIVENTNTKCTYIIFKLLEANEVNYYHLAPLPYDPYEPMLTISEHQFKRDINRELFRFI